MKVAGVSSWNLTKAYFKREFKPPCTLLNSSKSNNSCVVLCASRQGREHHNKPEIYKETSSLFKIKEENMDPDTVFASKSEVVFSSGRPVSELDAAATKLQKVYKGYCTRRNLADCAVVVEELWWKTLDFAALKQSSISFFYDQEQETAVSRWARTKTRIVKVVKCLSKDENEKAQELALHHWLEAIDPRHRYGHNLNLYYDIWFESQTTQPFFYWLDIGDGKEINLEKCPRDTLQSQTVY